MILIRSAFYTPCNSIYHEIVAQELDTASVRRNNGNVESGFTRFHRSDALSIANHETQLHEQKGPYPLLTRFQNISQSIVQVLKPFSTANSITPARQPYS